MRGVLPGQQWPTSSRPRCQDDGSPWLLCRPVSRPAPTRAGTIETPTLPWSGPAGGGRRRYIRAMLWSKIGATGTLRVIVPDYAKSDSTLLALTADTVVMSDSSELGPIDPQIHSSLAQPGCHRPPTSSRRLQTMAQGAHRRPSRRRCRPALRQVRTGDHPGLRKRH